MVQRIGEFFLDRGLITEEKLQEALLYQQKHLGTFIGEIMVDLDMISELDLLQYLSKRFRVQYITSEKLEKMPLNENANDIIPLAIAEKKNIFPLKYSFGNGQLSLLLNAPQDVELIDDLKIQLANVKIITPIVAIRKAIKALIAKQYQGDLGAFDRIFNRTVNMNIVVPTSEKILSISDDRQEKASAGMVEKELLGKQDTKENTKMSLTQIANQDMVSRHATITETITGIIPGYDHKLATADPNVIEIFRIFAGLFDSVKGREFRGHSQRVAVLARRIGTEIGLNDVELHNLTVAALLHDIGKQHHMGAFDIASRTHVDRLVKYASLPRRLFGTIKLPKQTVAYLENMYETWNGRGFPNALRLEEIPTGAQILQLSHTWDSLTYVSDLPLEEAFNRVAALKFFSKKLLDVFRKVQEIPDKQPVTQSSVVLLVAKDVDLLTILNEKLIHAGYTVIKATRMSEAANAIKKHYETMEAIVCDLSLSSDDITPVKLLKAVKNKPKLSKIRFFLFTKEGVSDDVKNAVKQLGAESLLENFNAETRGNELLSRINRKK